MENETNGFYSVSFFKNVMCKNSYQIYTWELEDILNVMKNPDNTIKDFTNLFVGGTAFEKDGKRYCLKRSMIVLDADHPKKDFLTRAHSVLDKGDYAYNTAWGYYTSASATQEQPRYRLILLIDKEIFDNELYRKICSAIMADIAPDDLLARNTDREFDWSSNEFLRLMYLPTKPSDDSYYEWDWFDGEPLSIDVMQKWLNTCNYIDAYSLHGYKFKRRNTDACYSGDSFNVDGYKEDPRNKDCIVGSFCKVYDIESAIQKYNLPYEPRGGRWIYTESESGIPGVTISEDGLFLYSRHESDPAHGELLNAYDLVMKHKGLTEREMYSIAFNDPDVRPIESKRYLEHKKQKSFKS